MMSVKYLFPCDSILFIATINRQQDEFTEYSHYKLNIKGKVGMLILT